MMHPDIKPYVFGYPNYPEVEAPDWEEFKADYVDHYFTGPPSEKGRCFVIVCDEEFCGQINYNQFYPDGVELDIWLSSGKFLGLGIGTYAINLMCKLLSEKFKRSTFYIAPSARNKMAIRTYEKAGFVKTTTIPTWFVPDYYDSVLMIKKWLDEKS